MTPAARPSPSSPNPNGPGPVATADDVITWPTSTPGNGSSPAPAAAPPGPAARPRQRHRPGHRRNRAGLRRPSGEPRRCPLHVACGNRRESACPACSAVYKRDARQLVRAGLAGGKGIPETVAAHPCVFATLTAPSFGPVHARRMRGKTVLPCRPRRDASKRVCPHGRDISCPVRHADDDPRLGRPMCRDCYDYEAAVLFNLHAGKLWKRFSTYLPRHLARLAGVTGKHCARELADPLRQGRRIPGTRRRPLPRRDPPRRQRQRRLPPPPARYTPRCCATPSTRPPGPSASPRPAGGRAIRLGFGRDRQAADRRAAFAATGRR